MTEEDIEFRQYIIDHIPFIGSPEETEKWIDENQELIWRTWLDDWRAERDAA